MLSSAPITGRRQRETIEFPPAQHEHISMLVLYDPVLVTLSVAIAIVGSYTGLYLASRIASSSGAYRKACLAGAAITIGGGIWAMHFVGMLAVSVPVALQYDLFGTFLSVLIAITMTGLGLFVANLPTPTSLRLAGGGVFMGAGIALMHYVGMAAIRGECRVAYDAGLVGASVLVALLSASLALWLAFNPGGWRRMIASAVAMGFAISGMHYTAMAAATFQNAAPPSALAPVLSQPLLATIVAFAAFLIVGCTILTFFPERPAPAASPTLGEGTEATSAGEAGEAQRLFKLPVVRNKATILLDLDQVVSIQAEEHYSRVFTFDASYFCPLSVSELETRLDPETFLRVHRSHIVNLHRARSFERRNEQGIILVDGALPRSVPVSRSRVPKLRHALGL
jgi:NO-binding membrane sensor protein with MHYT domain